MFLNAFQIAGEVLLAVLAPLLVYRRAYREVPLFFWYIAYICLSEVVKAVVHHYSLYAWWYVSWGSEIIVTPLRLAAIYQIILSVFAPYEAIQKLLRFCALWALGVLLVIGAVVAVSFPSNDAYALMNNVVVMERSFRIVDVGLLLFIFLFAYLLRMRWPQRALGIAAGFALFCGIDLVVFTVRSHLGLAAGRIAGNIDSASFGLALIAWNAAFLAAEQARAAYVLEVAQLREWNRALEAMLAR